MKTPGQDSSLEKQGTIEKARREESLARRVGDGLSMTSGLMGNVEKSVKGHIPVNPELGG